MKALPASLFVALFAAACAGPPAADDTAADASLSTEATPAEALLASAIAYHDPVGEWSNFAGVLEFEELRPDGDARRTDVGLDVSESTFSHFTTADGREVLKQVVTEGCASTVDGTAPTPEEVEAFSLECGQIERNRNYYLYLWGLPMKLLDPGTRIDSSVERTEFQGQPVDQIRVTYEAEVGGDTWYFYFLPESARMVGYRFYHDESVGDGEYITLDEEVAVGRMRLPARRRWFVNADDRFLGEDVLIGTHPLP
ncbi:MAG: hypothetical protein ACI9OJ_006004 [Myxococcota bacterium]|jgi:hypothetical protein